ncbi:MAG TPA: response regulator transcription factor [Candidatus Acidoferrales bacterium]|jgi:DNA-binding NarL/FixJ family response regulator|nr:response regulator transcription factor [Candidatus Acidoferrales bacterium]
MSERQISVLLVDDHSLVRRGFRRMLEDDPGITVVGEAEDGHQAVQLAAELRPAVVVMDFALPSMNGAVASRHILRNAPETAILILSMHAEASYVRTCLEAGVRGYLLKNAMDLEMVAAVKQVAAGKQVLDPRLGSLDQPSGQQPPQLTTRELEVLQLIVHGKSNKEIAAVLSLSANTVAVHRANIMQALGIHNTAELVVYAIRQGLVSIA